jgi:dTDP-4-dehydrorhamnose reductase
MTNTGGGKILVLGASSYIGRQLCVQFGMDNIVATYNQSIIDGGVKFDALSMRLADILDAAPDISHAIILFAEPNLNECAADVEVTRKLNVDSIVATIKDLNAAGIRTVFFSTDSVFDGVHGNYTETDIPNPVVQYGKQKREVEKFIQEHCDNYCIIRPTRVYGTEPGDGSIFNSWISALKDGDLIRVATDQKMSPILISDLTAGIEALIDMSATGIYHLAGPELNSRSGFFDMLVEEMLQYGRVEPRVEYCQLSDFDLWETPPLNVSLDATKFIAATGIQPGAPRPTIRRLLANAGYGDRNDAVSEP